MISDFLRYYRRNKRELAEAMQTTPREVELAIHRARLQGLPICSDADGYWLSEDPREVRECADRLRKRYIHQALTARALRATAKRLERAPTLWDAAA